MKKAAMFALFFAFLLSLNFLQPAQGGELEVRVKEKGTEKPIANAEMILRRVRDDTDRPIFVDHYYGGSNERGIGVFKNLPAGSYFIECKATGYASEPSLFVMNASGVASAQPPGKKFRSRQAIFDALKVFPLGENESKKMELSLEAGGAIRGLLRYVGCAETSVLHNQSFTLCMHIGNQDEYFVEGELESEFLYSDEDGLFKVDGLKASDRYFLRVQAQKYLPAVIEGIRVESGRTTRLDANVCSSREPSPSSAINSLVLSADGEWMAWGGPFSLYTARILRYRGRGGERLFSSIM